MSDETAEQKRERLQRTPDAEETPLEEAAGVFLGALFGGLKKAAAKGAVAALKNATKRATDRLEELAACDCSPGVAHVRGHDGVEREIEVHSPDCPSKRSQ